MKKISVISIILLSVFSVTLAVFLVSYFQKYEAIKANRDYYQSKYSEELENNRELLDQIYQFERKKYQEEIVKNSKPFVTEEQAMKYIADHYDFYAASKVYRNVRLRRIDDNSFNVQLEECPRKFQDREFHWNFWVKKLTVENDDKYHLSTGIPR